MGAVATLMGTTLTLTGAGLVSVTASQAGNDTHEAALGVRRFITVSKKEQAIMFTSPAVGIINTDIELTAIATSTLPVTFAVTNQSPTSGSGDVATLADNGTTLSLVGAGTVTITAMQAGNATYEAATTETQMITVSAIPLVSQTIMFNSPAASQTGSTITLAAMASSGLAVTFAVMDQSPASGSGDVATLADNGTTLSLVGAGTVTITATQAGGVGSDGGYLCARHANASHHSDGHAACPPDHCVCLSYRRHGGYVHYLSRHGNLDGRRLRLRSPKCRTLTAMWSPVRQQTLWPLYRVPRWHCLPQER